MSVRVRATAEELSSRIIKVEGLDEGTVILRSGETRTFEVKDDGKLTFSAAEDTDLPKAPEPGEVRDTSEHNNPNGITSASISAKFPKIGGETKQEVVDGKIIERTIGVDPALAVAAGGPDSTDGSTPGPQPDPGAHEGQTVGGQDAAATGSTDRSGNSTAKAATKTAAKKSSRR